MSPVLLFCILIGYFALLLGVAWATSRNANNDSFFIGNKSSNWMLVAFGMVGLVLRRLPARGRAGGEGEDGRRQPGRCQEAADERGYGGDGGADDDAGGHEDRGDEDAHETCSAGIGRRSDGRGSPASVA